MSNLFDGDGMFSVLRNDAGEFSFWPVHAIVPPGWQIVLAAVPRDEAETYVREHWTTLTPGDRITIDGE